MEPLGTITMYYQFLDQEIVDILDKIMKEAEDYYDFTERLVDYVCAKDVPINLGYIAAVHVWNIGHYELGRKLQPKFGKFAHIFGWIADSENQELYPWGRYADVALAEDHEDWTKTMVCYLKSVNYDRHEIYHITPYMEIGMEYIDKNPKLECFRPYLLHSRSGIILYEGDLQGAIADLEEGIRIARKYDDRYQASILLFLLGSRKMRIDVNDSWEYFDEAYRTADSIRHIQGVAFAINKLAEVARIRGEYDLALQSIFRAREMLVDAGVWTGFTALNCSRVYYSMKDRSQALLWARTTTEEMGGSGALVSVFERTRALILLGRLSDASSELKTANELVLKDSREEYFGLYKYVTGLLEVAEGKTLEGISSLEEALNIFEQNFNEEHVVPCLVDLAKAEVKNYNIGGDLDTSGPWMTRLEQRARERDYPGILMEHALLKAEFQMKQGAPEAAKKTLTDALDIYDSPGVRTLRKQIEEQLQSLIIDA